MYLDSLYHWLLAAHIIAVIFWMAALYYLPRLFMYHAQLPLDSARAQLLETMELRLLKIIATPSMLAAWVFGLWLLLDQDSIEAWLWVKIFLVLALSGYHGACAAWRKAFAQNKIPHHAEFFRKINELPPILTIFIVILVILKPF